MFLDVKNIYLSSNNVITEKLSITLIVIGLVISIFVIFYVFKNNEMNEGHKYSLCDAKRDKSITSEYLLSSILPLCVFDFNLWYGVVLFLIFFSTLCFLCIKHNYFSVNIILEIAGYSFYHCTLSNDDNIKISQILISRNNLSKEIGNSIYIKKVNNEYALLQKIS